MQSKRYARKKRIVLDTNILISSQISNKGTSSKIYNLLKKGKIVANSSPFQIKEFEKVLHYPRIKKKYNLSEPKIREILTILKENTDIVYPSKIQKIISEDPDDNQILAIAKEGKVDVIVSGDRHLLDLKRFGKIPIITAKEFVEKYLQ